MACLNALLGEIDVDFVISSQWRTQMPLEDVISYLLSDGFQGRIIGATPFYEIGCRGQEIDGWLADEGFEGSFAIIDDRADMEPHADHLVQTEFDCGFRHTHVPRVIEILNRPWSRTGLR